MARLACRIPGVWDRVRGEVAARFRTRVREFVVNAVVGERPSVDEDVTSVPLDSCGHAVRDVLTVADTASRSAEAFEDAQPGVLLRQAISMRLAVAIITAATGVRADAVS